ncbi:MAG TPA: ArsC/Spx/MgsR family protein [Pyrinomonadaceae bacterium]|nr:ArsC/Spx/MgsR family protein [Pyrinomonadaceae bacterium]HMP65940.1 ArsC/Spx/MgsR family protein [Pyrinomonadaceae bacterium]
MIPHPAAISNRSLSASLPPTQRPGRVVRHCLQTPAFGLLRTKEKEFKERGFTPETPENEITDAIVANPGLLNRPIVVVGGRAVIARPIERAPALVSIAATRQ